MPRLNQQDINVPGSGNFTFSYVAPEHLQELTYTLVVISRDKSSSVGSYSKELDDCIKNIVQTCRRSPKAENILIRVVDFNDRLDEVHGFKPLKDIDENDYAIRCGGTTALYNTFYENIESVVQYSEILNNQDFDVNAVVFVITDGSDNASSVTESDINDLIQRTKNAEQLESFTTVLVGIGTENEYLNNNLTSFQQNADITQFVSIGSATPADLARLGIILSKSISVVSQSLGTGKAPKPDKSDTLVF
jgi:uncharacterized protein YegL